MREFESCKRCGTNMNPIWNVIKEYGKFNIPSGRVKVVCTDFVCEFCNDTYKCETNIYDGDWILKT